MKEGYPNIYDCFISKDCVKWLWYNTFVTTVTCPSQDWLVEHAVKNWFMEPSPTMKGLRCTFQNAPTGVERSSHPCAAV